MRKSGRKRKNKKGAAGGASGSASSSDPDAGKSNGNSHDPNRQEQHLQQHQHHHLHAEVDLDLVITEGVELDKENADENVNRNAAVSKSKKDSSGTEKGGKDLCAKGGKGSKDKSASKKEKREVSDAAIIKDQPATEAVTKVGKQSKTAEVLSDCPEATKAEVKPDTSEMGSEENAGAGNVQTGAASMMNEDAEHATSLEVTDSGKGESIESLDLVLEESTDTVSTGRSVSNAASTDDCVHDTESIIGDDGDTAISGPSEGEPGRAGVLEDDGGNSSNALERDGEAMREELFSGDVGSSEIKDRGGSVPEHCECKEVVSVSAGPREDNGELLSEKGVTLLPSDQPGMPESHFIGEKQNEAISQSTESASNHPKTDENRSNSTEETNSNSSGEFTENYQSGSSSSEVEDGSPQTDDVFESQNYSDDVFKADDELFIGEHERQSNATLEPPTPIKDLEILEDGDDSKSESTGNISPETISPKRKQNLHEQRPLDVSATGVKEINKQGLNATQTSLSERERERDLSPSRSKQSERSGTQEVFKKSLPDGKEKSDSTSDVCEVFPKAITALFADIDGSSSSSGPQETTASFIIAGENTAEMDTSCDGVGGSTDIKERKSLIDAPSTGTDIPSDLPSPDERPLKTRARPMKHETLQEQLRDHQEAMTRMQAHAHEQQVAANLLTTSLRTKLRRKDQELKLVRSQSEKQISAVISHLLYLEGQMQKEHKEIFEILQEKDDVIRRQKAALADLSTKNGSLLKALRETHGYASSASSSPENGVIRQPVGCQVVKENGSNYSIQDHGNKVVLRGEKGRAGEKSSTPSTGHKVRFSGVKDKLRRHKSSLELYHSEPLETLFEGNQRYYGSEENLVDDTGSIEDVRHFSNISNVSNASSGGGRSERCRSLVVYPTQLKEVDEALSHESPDSCFEDFSSDLSHTDSRSSSTSSLANGFSSPPHHGFNELAKSRSVPQALPTVTENDGAGGTSASGLKARPHSLPSVDFLASGVEMSPGGRSNGSGGSNKASSSGVSPTVVSAPNSPPSESNPFKSFKNVFKRRGSKKKRSVSLGQDTNKEYHDAVKQHFRKYDLT